MDKGGCKKNILRQKDLQSTVKSFFFYTKEKQKSLTLHPLHSLLFKVVRKCRYKGETVTSLLPSLV